VYILEGELSGKRTRRLILIDKKDIQILDIFFYSI